MRRNKQEKTLDFIHNTVDNSFSRKPVTFI